jgi:hypothetical protein
VCTYRSEVIMSLIVLLFAFLMLFLLYHVNRSRVNMPDACAARGGIVVQTNHGYMCLDVKPK